MILKLWFEITTIPNHSLPNTPLLVNGIFTELQACVAS